MKEYYYKLQLVDGQDIKTHQFSAMVNAKDLAYALRDFLAGCGWNEKCLKKIFNTEEYGDK